MSKRNKQTCPVQPLDEAETRVEVIWLHSYRTEFWERKTALRSYQKLADELGVSKGTLQRFVKYGKVPASKELRDKLGINPPKEPSRGKLIYDARSEKARLKGWESLSEFLTAVDNGEAEIPHKKVVDFHIMKISI